MRWNNDAKYVCLVRDAAQAAWHNFCRNQELPFRVLPLSRFPRLSRLPGHTPAHEAR